MCPTSTSSVTNYGRLESGVRKRPGQPPLLSSCTKPIISTSTAWQPVGPTCATPSRPVSRCRCEGRPLVEVPAQGRVWVRLHCAACVGADVRRLPLAASGPPASRLSPSHRWQPVCTPGPPGHTATCASAKGSSYQS